MQTCIEINNLTKCYGKARGIIELNLTVDKGEIFGFIGPNGAGKSTTIRSLLGLITPTSGTAKIFGLDVQKNKKEILSRIGYMPSEAMFYNGMKVEDIIKLSANLHNKNCDEQAKILCERLQLDGKRKVEELSLGNRKKVSIVCAMQHEPDLYILDEPTSGLDPLMQKEFFALLKEKHDRGATLFLSSHVLSEIQHNCTKAAIIREGRLIVCDTVEALSSTNTRRVSVRLQSDSVSLLQNTIMEVAGEDVKNITCTDKTVEFLYTGRMKILLDILSSYEIDDLRVTEPDLEEIFMHYYVNGGDNNGNI